MNADQVALVRPRERAERADGSGSLRGMADRLTLAVTVAAAAAAISGLLWDGLYTSGRTGTGAEATAQMLRGNDLVTLVLAVPALAWASTGPRRTRTSARLVTAGMLAYLGYTFAYHVFGNGFTDLLLLHVAVVSGSAVALILALSDLRSYPAPRVHLRTVRPVAVALAVLAAALGIMWTIAALAYAVAGDLPSGSMLVETDQVVQLGIVLDLMVLVPLYAVAAVLLWRGRWWGLVLAAVALVAGVLHQVSYLVALVFQDVGGVPGAVGFDALEPIILLVYAGATVVLFRAVSRASTGR